MAKEENTIKDLFIHVEFKEKDWVLVLYDKQKRKRHF